MNHDPSVMYIDITFEPADDAGDMLEMHRRCDEAAERWLAEHPDFERAIATHAIDPRGRARIPVRPCQS